MSKSPTNSRVSELLRFTEAHNRHRDLLARATGETFNIFRVLGVGHLEVKTHSPILAELLNPRGKHGQGAAFLDLFLDRFAIPNFDSKTAIAIPEYHVGPVTEDSGGRIDIVIRDGNGAKILIENKIYAGDQENQMPRYRNFDRKARLFYLTLFKSDPSNLTPEEAAAIRLEPISYADDILGWLRDCRKEAACLPRVRETLSQYIHLIEELTHQSTNQLMNADLIEKFLDTPESLQAFYTIRDAESAIRAELLARLDKSLTELARELGLELEGTTAGLASRFGQIKFTSAELNRLNLAIWFEFGSSNFNDLNFGLGRAVEGIPSPAEEAIRLAFGEKLNPNEPNENWIAWTAFEQPYRYWGPEAFEGIRSGRFAQLVKEKLETLLEIVRVASGGKVVEGTS